ncbi:hypothetical protein ACTWP5_21520 [Streptomyces sp. 4N509B]|uniref:hypothetical protein n=1 Tax=Streptomyces sp. 4N509B TaxID=3457413 RepID=UPI003FD68563
MARDVTRVARAGERVLPSSSESATPPPLPVLPALRGLLPGLRRGQAVTVDGVGALPLALLAGPSAGGAWCAVVGLPECGMLAAAGMGVDLDRLLLVDEPGERWAEVVAALLPAVEVVMVRPVPRPSPQVVRRLTALARRHGATLVVAGPWEDARVRLRVESSLWTGLGDGHGHLRGRRVRVVAEGRGVAGGRPRSAWLWLPAPDGGVAGSDLEVLGAAG